MTGLGFVIEDRGNCRCVVWDNGGVSPATLAECALWDALHTQPPAVGVDVSDEMVERAMGPLPSGNYDHPMSEYQQGCADMMQLVREEMPAALHAALRTGGGVDHG